MKLVLLFCIILLCGKSYALNNGLARTPPMGWLSWERFRCNTDCINQPDECISEKLYMDMADRMKEDGWLDAGYTQVNIDDCWMARERTFAGNLAADPSRFPSGIKYLADYIHAKGLKLGIYADFGNHTCSGYPGSMGFEKKDAQTFAAWGVDMLKLDGCESTDMEKEKGYPLMSKELNATGRPIIYSCSWPAEAGNLPPKINFTLMAEICNLWRNYNDISDSFDDVLKIINWFGEHQDVLVPAAGPGHWNDPDMIIGGDYSLSYDQAKLQFGMWAILAAPLFLSSDLRNMDEKMSKLLQDEQIILISQDVLGKQGYRVRAAGSHQLWVRPLHGGQQAIAVFNLANSGGPSKYGFALGDLKIENPYSKYVVYDIADISKRSVHGLNDVIEMTINPQGITIYRAEPVMAFSEVEVDEIVFDIL